MNEMSRRDFVHCAAASALPAYPVMRRAPVRFQLGIVTYNIAANWDLPTILKVCKNVGLAAVELRTMYKHGVEPKLTKEERRDVRQRFAGAGISIWGCGTVCEFHAPDRAVVARNIEMCKQFAQLTADIGGRGVKVRPNDFAPNNAGPTRPWSRSENHWFHAELPLPTSAWKCGVGMNSQPRR